MQAYIYRAALYCENCAARIKGDLRRAGVTAPNTSDESSYDSDDYPKGPYADGGGEADAPQHCDSCDEFLENPLTSDGARYVAECVREAKLDGRDEESTAKCWEAFYGLEVG